MGEFAGFYQQTPMGTDSMTSSKITTFDEIEYRKDLERAGLSQEDAANLAAQNCAHS
jgi:hypothetical protein